MRYTIEDIRQMPEGQTFDCKSIHIEPKALANTIVAMANADGGMIAVGISDRNRRIEGIDQDKAHLNEILRTPFDFCVPTISVTTEFMPCQDSEGNDNHILIIHVPASPRLHANQADEVFWRVGDKSRKLPFEERMQLMYDKGERYYEDSPAYDATIEDIDMDAVKAYMKRIGYSKSPMEYLQENKGFLTYKGDVPQVSTACFKTDREYPKFVIQEMTVNSVCHRDYSIKGTEIQIKMFDNRLVFETPGKLPGIVRTDNIRHTHFSRNPKIAEFLKAYDYVKEFGEGVDRMCRELSAIGTKEPHYHLVAFIMKASVWANVLKEGQKKARKGQESIPSDQVECDTTQKNHPEKLPRNYPETTQKQDIDITPVQKGIIDFLLLHPYAGRKEISSNLGSLSEDGVKYNLKILQQKGVIKRIGPAKGGYWKVLSDETRGTEGQV